MMLNDKITRAPEINISKVRVADIFDRLTVQFAELYGILQDMKASGRKVSISHDLSASVPASVLRNVPLASGNMNKSRR